MANSTTAIRPAKPRPDFPLFPHASGRWAKKVRGKLCYFGKWADDPEGERALSVWLSQRDDLLAGRTPRATPDGLIVADLANRFLTAKEQQRDAGDITPRTFSEYYTSCENVVVAFGRTRLVDDLAADDFGALRASLAKRYGPHRLGKEVQLVRTLFKYGYDAGLIDKPVRYGPTFKRPAARLMRAHRQANGERMFEAAEIRQLLDAADQPLKAMILLGINCGFGNHDCGTLPRRAVDLERGWIDFPRPKTSVARRCPLWPATVDAIREALAQRPAAKQREHDKLVFITKPGGPWAKDTADSPVSKAFRELLDRLKLHRPGLGFYALRHTFETIAGEAKDQVATNHIMGHVDASMSGVYRERISDDRLRAVTEHVRQWLFAGAEEK